MAHVYTVYCPVHKGAWTGEFNATNVEQAVCKDCIAKGEGTKKGHPDIHINPSQEQ